MTLNILDFKNRKKQDCKLPNRRDCFLPAGLSLEEYSGRLRRRKKLGESERLLAKSTSTKQRALISNFFATGYGLLYNYYAYSNEHFAIPGTRVPFLADYQRLINFVGNASNAGFLLKGIKTSGAHPFWTPPNNVGQSNLMFNAYPAGYRDKTGQYQDFGTIAKISTLTKDGFHNDITHLTLQNNLTTAVLNDVPVAFNDQRKAGFSIRLLIDDDSPLFKQFYEGMTITDPNGNVYGLVKIGKQIWTTSNYAATILHNENLIPLIEDTTEWSEAETLAYCYPNGNPALVGKPSTL